MEKRQKQEAAAERARAAADQAVKQLKRFRAAERARLAAIAAGSAGTGETSSASPSRRPDGASDCEAGDASLSRQVRSATAGLLSLHRCCKLAMLTCSTEPEDINRSVFKQT